VVVALFIGLIVSAEEIFRDRKILKRERYLNLSSSSYLISKVIILFSISAVQTMSFILIGNWILEIPFSELRYWLILFSCSCFANILGLNISSAFDSAVTIYILIPILIIPQLLLSGVVIPFDKFNPKVGTPNGIPVLGEMMTSRWAFEAFMVTQFKDNPFEKNFYELDKEAALAEYKKVYYIPALESRLTFVLSNRMKWRDRSEANPVKKSLDLLRTEIGYEVSKFGSNRFPELEKLQVGKFDSLTFKKTDLFLRTLKQYYTMRLRNASSQKDSILSTMTNTAEKMEAYNQMRMRYENESVHSMVTNTGVQNRIVEWREQLVQKIYPIYFEDHRPRNAIDFSSNFYVPTKPFVGKIFDTYYFNIAMIWFFCVMLYIALYYQWLRKLVNGFERYKKYRIKDRE